VIWRREGGKRRGDVGGNKSIAYGCIFNASGRKVLVAAAALSASFSLISLLHHVCTVKVKFQSNACGCSTEEAAARARSGSKWDLTQIEREIQQHAIRFAEQFTDICHNDHRHTASHKTAFAGTRELARKS
jgi:hypothetical protein